MLAFAFLALGACSDEDLNLFFDIPPPTPEELRAEAEKKAATEREAAAQAAKAAGAPAAVAEDKGERPEIEKTLVWKDVEAKLPKDKKGRIDWGKAEREGVIKPRDRIDANDPLTIQMFKYDFFIPSEDPADDAYFPHSSHTKWVACESCHPKLFPLRHQTFTKSEIKKGLYCGGCHKKTGSATFWLRACERCHLGPARPKLEEEAGE